MLGGSTRISLSSSSLQHDRQIGEVEKMILLVKAGEDAAHVPTPELG